jgi:hypothetical protein
MLMAVQQIFQQDPPQSTSSHTRLTDIHHVTTSVNKWMRCPCSLCESLDHFTYQCPTIIEYRCCQMDLIQNPPNPSLPVIQVIPPTPSPYIIHILSPEPEALPTPPWFMDNLYEDFTPNPPNSPVDFPMEIVRLNIIFNPEYLDFWFMSSESSQPPYITPSTSSPPEDHHMVTTTNVTPLYPLYYCQFHCDKDILEELTTPDFPWNTLHHREIFLSQEVFEPPSQDSIYAIETKYFIPSEHID